MFTSIPSLIPSNLPYAAFVNNSVKYSQYMPMAALVRQAQLSYQGDPMVGQLIPGTTLKWEDATFVQGLISLWYSEGGNDPNGTLQAAMDQFRGPFLPWNYSYTQWGLTPESAPRFDISQSNSFNPVDPKT